MFGYPYFHMDALRTVMAAECWRAQESCTVRLKCFCPRIFICMKIPIYAFMCFCASETIDEHAYICIHLRAYERIDFRAYVAMYILTFVSMKMESCGECDDLLDRAAQGRCGKDNHSYSPCNLSA